MYMFSIFRERTGGHIMVLTGSTGGAAMDAVGQNRHVLLRLLEERRGSLPRPARLFLEDVVRDDELLRRMRFCRQDERGRLRNSVLISLEDGPCWAVLLGNDPTSLNGSQARARLALEGLDLSPAQVLGRLRELPIWFLALDPAYACPPPGEAARVEETGYRLARLDAPALRRQALHDQLDAALEQNDREAWDRIAAQLGTSE